MVAQLSLFDTEIYSFLSYKRQRERGKPKRVRAKYPSYIKVYSVYQYDHTKYRELFKPIIKEAIEKDDPDIYWNTNPYDLLNKCYYRDKSGNKKRLGDTKHIYRYKTLYKLFEAIGKEIYKGQLKLDTEVEY